MATAITFRANVDLNNENCGERSFEKMKFAYLALEPNDLVPVNLDVVTMVATVVGACPEVRALRNQAAELKGFDPACIDDLEDAAYALQFAHRNYQISIERDDGLSELTLEASQTRDRLYAEVRSLCVSGLLDDVVLKDFTAGTGYKDVITGTQILVQILKNNQEALKGKLLHTEPELERAELLTNRMVRLIGLREQSTKTSADWADLRQRAYSLLARHYDQVRRAVTYLRWDKGDVDTISPSLYAGRKRTSKTEVPDPDKTEPTAPTTPVPVPGTPGSASPNNVSPNGPFVPSVTPTLPNTNQQPKTPITGMPGGSPFIQ